MRNIIILGITSLFTDISTEMVYPLIPLYLVAQLGATPGIVGIIEGIAESLASLLKLYAGHISDKFGKRKPLAIFGYSFSGIGLLPASLITGWLWTFFGPKAAFITGGFLGLTAAIAMGIILGRQKDSCE